MPTLSEGSTGAASATLETAVGLQYAT
jgi:hypothetical protein